ncbi:DUF4064 domain-containing protein [Staphylococcus simulans]|uniref:DUF4064 domain-containing protein n=1 Tax=Staphylococcus simulans TaxID=1286 RepID=UPI003F7E741A
MNRKAEKILGWIGVGLTLIYMLLFLIGIFMGKGMLSDILLKQGDPSMSPEYLHQTLIFTTIGLIVVAIIAAIGLVLIKKNRIASGIILIIAAIAGIFFSNFIATILFFIAGIMLFVRRSKAKSEADKAYDREHNYFDAVSNPNRDLDQREKRAEEHAHKTEHASEDKGHAHQEDAAQHEDLETHDLTQQRRRSSNERPTRHDLGDDSK